MEDGSVNPNQRWISIEGDERAIFFANEVGRASFVLQIKEGEKWK